MFTCKTFLAAALLIGIGSAAYSLPRTSGKVAPLSQSESKLKKCEMHGTALKIGTAPITYGIVSGFPAGYYQASQRAFPHAKSRLAGGCVISQDSPKAQTVKYCSKCRAAGKVWLDAHKPAKR